MTSDELQLFGGTWTDQKLAILAEYLKKYNTALKNQPFIRVYIDAFAGAGYRRRARLKMGGFDIFRDVEEAEAQEFLKGSARIALEVDPPFDKYVFVESDEGKVAELELLKEAHPDRAGAVEIVQGDANAYVQRFCQTMPSNMRAVVFLDPFATQVEWATIEAIAASKAVDVWILFPLMAVNRSLANDSEKVCRGALNRIFGTSDWFGEFYRTHTETDFFRPSFEAIRKECDFDSIGRFYVKRLKHVFAGVAPQPRVFRNSKNSPLFQLFFAAGNKAGAPIAVRIAEYLLEKW